MDPSEDENLFHHISKLIFISHLVQFIEY